jgi:hypothetical protein
MDRAIRQESATPWYRHRWPWFIMLGPAAVMAATAVTVVMALRQPDAMVVDDYYKQGKAINQDLRRDRMASALRLSLSAHYARGRLEGRLESFGRPMLAPFRIRLAHPTQPRKDRVLEAWPDGEGNVDVPLPALEMTHWQVVVEDVGGQWRLARGWSPAKEELLEIVADAPL